MMQQELTDIAGVTVFSRRRNHDTEWLRGLPKVTQGSGVAETDTQKSDSEVHAAGASPFGVRTKEQGERLLGFDTQWPNHGQERFITTT